MSALDKISSVIFLADNGRTPEDSPPYWGKFILATVSHQGESKSVFRSIASATWGHRNIVDRLEIELSREHADMRVQVNGGGTVAVHPSANTVLVGGSSESYGMADYTVAQQLLKAALPSWLIEIAPDLK